jgi:hypothetical protein
MIVSQGISLFALRFVPAVNNVISHPDVVAQAPQFLRLKPKTTARCATIHFDL